MPGVSTYAVLQYFGQHFSGWQRQKSMRTVQEDVESVLERLVGRRVVTHAAGRTDAGVHALGQVVSFAVPDRWPPEKLLRAFRALLPPDVWPLKVEPAPDGFDARRHAIARRYEYLIGCDAASASPFRRPFEWDLGKPLDLALLRCAAVAIMGEHDFRAFSAVGQDKPHYRCHITHAEWRKRSGQEGFIFTIEADRFLHRMVRFLVGAMVEVALRRRAPDTVEHLLLQTNNRDASPPAPPQGLYMMGARYPQFAEVITR